MTSSGCQNLGSHIAQHCGLTARVQKGFISSTRRPSARSRRQAELQGEAKANPASRSAGKPPILKLTHKVTQVTCSYPWCFKSPEECTQLDMVWGWSWAAVSLAQRWRPCKEAATRNFTEGMFWSHVTTQDRAVNRLFNNLICIFF